MISTTLSWKQFGSRLCSFVQAGIWYSRSVSYRVEGLFLIHSAKWKGLLELACVCFSVYHFVCTKKSQCAYKMCGRTHEMLPLLHFIGYRERGERLTQDRSCCYVPFGCLHCNISQSWTGLYRATSKIPYHFVQSTFIFLAAIRPETTSLSQPLRNSAPHV